MVKKYYNAEYTLRDGKILIYKRPDSQNYQCRLLLPNNRGYIIKSCKSKNLGKATQQAEELYDRYSYKILKKLPLQLQTFADVYKNFLRISNKEERRRAFYEGCFERYFSVFFDGMYVDTLTKTIFDEYFLWRKAFYTNHPEKRRGNTAVIPSYQTLVLEKKILKEVMKYAYHTRLISEIPEIEYVDNRRDKVSNRDDFSPDEYKAILLKLREFANKKLRPQVDYQRKMLYWLVVFLANTGIRPSEYYKLQWRDITLHKIQGSDTSKEEFVLEIIIPTKTKTGKRVVISNPQAFTSYIKIQEFSKYTKETDYVFTNYDGSCLKHIGNTFTRRLKELGLYISRNGKKRPLYSLRHYYATERLKAGASIYDVALNLGTSVQLIEKHYSHMDIAERAKNITEHTSKSSLVDRRLIIGAWYANDKEMEEKLQQQEDNELPL